MSDFFFLIVFFLLFFKTEIENQLHGFVFIGVGRNKKKKKLLDVIVIDKQMFQKDSFKRPLCLNSKICIGPAPTLKEMLAFL